MHDPELLGRTDSVAQAGEREIASLLLSLGFRPNYFSL